MVKKTNKKFYRNISRKELQHQCKKFKLPANKSHSYLANSLASFFKNLESASPRKRFSAFKEPSLPTCILQLPSQKLLNSAVKSKKDGTCGFVYRSGHKNSDGAFSQIDKKRNARNNMEENASVVDCFNGLIGDLKETSLSVLQCDENDVNQKSVQRKSPLMRSDYMPLFGNRPIEKGTCLSENASIASLKTHVKAPSFEFHVSSEAGITLHVDLNLSPSDWTERFHNEVFVCENMHKNKCRILPKDLGFPTKGSEEIMNSLSNDQVQIISCLNSEIVSGDRVGLKQSDKIDGSLMFSKITSCSLTFDPSEPMKEDEALVSAENRSAAHKLKLPNSDKSAQNNEHAFLDFDCDDILHRKANRVIAIPSPPSVPAKLKHRNSIIGGESFDFPSMQNSNSLFDLFVESPGFVENSSVKMQLSEVSSLHMDESWSLSETGGTLDLVNVDDAGERQERRFNNSRDTSDAPRCHLHPSMEERQKSDIFSMLKVSECVQLTNLMEKTCLGDENLESKKAHKKRKRVEDMRPNQYLKSHTRILRSTKHIDNSPRRSKRLISK